MEALKTYLRANKHVKYVYLNAKGDSWMFHANETHTEKTPASDFVKGAPVTEDETETIVETKKPNKKK